jgi:hypothetical protein
MFDFLTSFILIAFGNYITTNVNVTLKLITMLQLVYGVDTYNHAMHTFPPHIRYDICNSTLKKNHKLK